MFTTSQKQRAVKHLSPSNRTAIEHYLKGAVAAWIKAKGCNPFAARDLMGGINKNWMGTPCEVLYLHHQPKGVPAIVLKSAGQDLGWILRDVLRADRRTFTVCRKGQTCAYQY